MNMLEKIETISALVDKCVGSRPLTKVSEETGISRNKLFRLKNGEISRLPSVDDLMLLTNANANPQNGVTFSDFEAILNDADDDKTIQSKPVNKGLIASRKVCGAIVSHYLTLGKSITVLNDDCSNIKFDFGLTINEKNFYYDFKYAETKITNPRRFEKTIDSIIIRLAKVSDNGVYVIVTNNNALFKMLTNTPWYLVIKIEAMLVDLDTLEIVAEEKLN